MQEDTSKYTITCTKKHYVILNAKGDDLLMFLLSYFYLVIMKNKHTHINILK